MIKPITPKKHRKAIKNIQISDLISRLDSISYIDNINYSLENSIAISPTIIVDVSFIIEDNKQEMMEILIEIYKLQGWKVEIVGDYQLKFEI